MSRTTHASFDAIAVGDVQPMLQETAFGYSRRWSWQWYHSSWCACWYPGYSGFISLKRVDSVKFILKTKELKLPGVSSCYTTKASSEKIEWRISFGVHCFIWLKSAGFTWHLLLLAAQFLRWWCVHKKKRLVKISFRIREACLSCQDDISC